MNIKKLVAPQDVFEWVVFVVFSICTTGIWYFQDLVTIVLFAKQGVLPSTPVVQSATLIILVVTSLLFAAVTLLVLAKHRIERTERTALSEEMVSDLMLSQEQFKMLYDGSPVPYFLMDDIGNIRNPNRATLRFLEGTSDDITLSNFYSLLIHEDEGVDDVSMLRTKVGHAVPITKEELSIKTLAGKTRWANVSIYSLDSTSPIPFKHLVTAVDITKERESEQVKTDFLLLASHQLRTPLTTIKWYIDYLLTSATVQVTDDVREYLEQIYIGNERMIELITTLLTVSRIEMGTLAPEYVGVHIKELVQDVLDELKPETQKKSITHVVEIEDDDLLTTDRTMVRIAIHNLLTNAIKYTPSGGTVRTTGVFNSSAGVITVTDNGYGVPLDEQYKIFSKLFRATNARKISANGTGLGLYLSKAFVEKLGGSIDFASEEGKGTTFSITMPRVAPKA